MNPKDVRLITNRSDGGGVTADELNWNDLHQVDPVTRRVIGHPRQCHEADWLQGCSARTAVQFSSVQFVRCVPPVKLNRSKEPFTPTLALLYAARCCARDSNSVYFNGDIYACAVAKRLLCFTSAAQRRAGHRERQCADTTGTVLVPSTGHFQCWSTNSAFL